MPIMTPGFIHDNYILDRYIHDEYWIDYGIPRFVRGVASISDPLGSNPCASKCGRT